MDTFHLPNKIAAFVSALALAAQVMSCVPSAFAATPSWYFYNEDGCMVEDGQASPIRYSGIWAQNTYYDFGDLSHNSRYDNDYDIIRAIDVSSHQGVVDWNAVAAQGIGRVYLRIGLRGWGTQGYLAKDTRFVENLIGAKNAGLQVGAYFYTQALNPDEAIAEAQLALSVLDAVPGYTLDLPLYYDVEKAESGSEIGRVEAACLSVDEFTANTRAFCSTIEAAGLQAGIYACKDYLENHLRMYELEQEYDVWLANYNLSTSYAGAYSIWQYCDGGWIDGISEKVDMDVVYVPHGSAGTGLYTPDLSEITLQAPDLSEITGITDDFGTETAIVTGITDDFGTETAIVTGITDDFGTETAIVTGVTDDFGTETAIVTGVTDDFGTETGIVTGITDDFGDVSLAPSVNYIASGMTLHDIGDTVTPILAGNGPFAFLSSDPDVAQVNADGTITATGIGEAMVTAFAANGMSDSITITVGLPTHVALDSTTLLFDGIGGREQISFTASPAYALLSSDTDVFTVSPEGLVVATGYGTAELTLVDPDGGESACTIVVPQSTPSLGDCNLDGMVNAADAADILTFAAEAGSGTGNSLTNAHRTLYDCNSDGTINAADASDLLAYCAALGAN